MSKGLKLNIGWGGVEKGSLQKDRTIDLNYKVFGIVSDFLKKELELKDCYSEKIDNIINGFTIDLSNSELEIGEEAEIGFMISEIKDELNNLGLQDVGINITDGINTFK